MTVLKWLCVWYSGWFLRTFNDYGNNMEHIHFFLMRIVWSGVQFGPFGTEATKRPIVPAPGDHDDGEFGAMIIGRGNRSTRRKPASSATLSITNPTCSVRARTRAAAVGSRRLIV
jgi:hypothetical protein